MSGEKKVIGLAGWSGSGKTTLLSKLLPELTKRGHRVSTIKHAHHKFDVDRPGKDSWVHRQSGASEVLVSSNQRWALMHELRDEPEATLDYLLTRLSPVDLVIVEGFKREPHAKLEVYRPDIGKPMLAEEDPDVVALLTDRTLETERTSAALPCLDLNDIPAIADFIELHCGLEQKWKQESLHGPTE
ncbi:MAG: molybdopterin-guanine dinucleotide biosynthesis protein B [Pseudomonadota bacterium]|uniref:molybdopterin-guanine dinucleotide biosynthesis protein B n=1 Tax=Fodinicurvata fenggangensis TaxID=1121830 RepID=UPI000479D9A2|nr:molybdopterin-guanine dinucleotide biosynthesis protein B [Fodinicurvata fenggangensis]